MIAATADQAEARLTLVLDHGNTDPKGDAIAVPADVARAAPAPVISKRQAIKARAEVS